MTATPPLLILYAHLMRPARHWSKVHPRPVILPFDPLPKSLRLIPPFLVKYLQQQTHRSKGKPQDCSTDKRALYTSRQGTISPDLPVLVGNDARSVLRLRCDKAIYRALTTAILERVPKVSPGVVQCTFLTCRGRLSTSGRNLTKTSPLLGVFAIFPSTTAAYVFEGTANNATMGVHLSTSWFDLLVALLCTRYQNI